MAPPGPGGALHSEKPPLPWRSTPVFWFHPSGDLLKGAKCGRSPEGNSSKSLPCQETLQLVDILREEKASIAAVYSVMGARPAAKMVWPKISKVGTAKKHFSRLMARQLVARAQNRASRRTRCVFHLETRLASCPYTQKGQTA